MSDVDFLKQRVQVQRDLMMTRLKVLHLLWSMGHLEFLKCMVEEFEISGVNLLYAEKSLLLQWCCCKWYRAV